MQLAELQTVNAERAARRAVLVVTDIKGGAQRVVKAADVAADPLKEVLQKRLRLGKSGMEETPEGEVFVTVHVPSAKLVITGAVHISQAMAPMAKVLDLDLIVIDPRSAFATPERFPGVTLLAEWPEEAIGRIGLDAYTAFVALTHDPKIDDPALKHALERDCFYIGALGSRKTHAKRVDRLKQNGFDEAAIGRIHAPIGLDIDAVSPPEIAVAILGEITATLRRRDGA